MKRSILIFAGIIALTVCLLFSSCSFDSRQGSTEEKELNHADQKAIDVTMTQLLASPKDFDGKLIRVIGVGNLEFEGNYLSLSKEDYKYRTGNQIWIELSDKATPYADAQEYNGKYVIVEGVFDKDDRGHLGLFHGAIKDINRYELWERE